MSEESVESWVDYLSSKARSAQLITKDAPELSTLEQSFIKHLKDVKRHSFKADKRLLFKIFILIALLLLLSKLQIHCN